MKRKTLISTLAAFGLWAFAMNLHAQIIQTLTFNVTATEQTEISDDGTNTTGTSAHQARHTVDLLKVLALDELAAGNYGATNFPAGAKLVVSNGVFLVLDKTNKFLADVSSILNFDQPTGNEVDTGKMNDGTGLANPSITRLYIGTLIFDDTSITNGQSLQFYLQGLVKETVIDSVSTKNGTYTETRTAQLTSGTGDGTSGGSNSFVLVGTVTATGKGTFSIPNNPTRLPK